MGNWNHFRFIMSVFHRSTAGYDSVEMVSICCWLLSFYD